MRRPAAGDDEWTRAWISASLHTNRLGGFPTWGGPASPRLMPLVLALQVLERDQGRRDVFEAIKSRVQIYAALGGSNQSSQWAPHSAEFKDLHEYLWGALPSPRNIEGRVDSAGQAQESTSRSGSSGLGRRGPPTAQYDGESLITKVTVKGIVRRPLCEIAKDLNPVTWSQTSAKGSGFSRSYKVELQGERVVYEPDGTPRQARPQPKEDEGWKGVLFEDVDVSSHGVPINGFRNLLNIDFGSCQHGACDPAASEPRPALVFEFDLRQALSSSHLGVSRPGGLEIDSGGAKVYCFNDAFKAFKRDIDGPSCSGERPENPDTWYVEIYKTLRFATLTPRVVSASPLHSGQVMNYLAPAVVTAWMDLAALLGVFKQAPKGTAP